MTAEPAAQTAIAPALALVEQAPRAGGREIRVVQDSVPVLDTARFEHLQRIASVMADSTLCPDALCMGKDENGNLVRLSNRQIVANCFLVTNQAVRWGMDPFAVAQCVFLVHGKLGYEGKLIAAVIETKLGVRLDYRIDAGKGDALGVVVGGVLPGETKERTINGTVALWRTTGSNSPWGNPGNWERQLRYRGAREWARAHAPAVLLGVYSADELEELNVSRMRDITPPSPRLQAAEAPPPPSAILAPKAAATVAQPATSQPDIPADTKRPEPTKQPATGEAPAPPVAVERPSKKAADKPANVATKPATKTDIQPDRKPLPSGLTAALEGSLAVLGGKEEEPVAQFDEEKFFANLETKMVNADKETLNELGAHIDGHKEFLSLAGNQRARDMYFKLQRQVYGR